MFYPYNSRVTKIRYVWKAKCLVSAVSVLRNILASCATLVAANTNSHISSVGGS